MTFSSPNLPYTTHETPQGTSSYSTSNRISDYTYDAAGNVRQVSDTVRSFRYDAENRQVKACNGCADINSSPTATYFYDGAGLRISKTVNGQTTTYVYDAFGNLAAEYGQVEASPCGTLTCYLTVDHLGSTRLLTDSSGAAARRYDYLPFGQELLAGMGARTTGLGYVSAADDSNPKLTGEVRDAETALDWLAIRAVSGAQGRFQSVDPANAGAYSADPQTWNGYSYVANNPLSYTDPSGQGWGSFFLHLGEAIFNAISLGYGNQIWGGNTLNIGGITSGVNDGPWNEQAPIGGGSVNTGGVFGGGAAGPFVFGFEDSGQPAGWQVALSNAADLVAAVGDAISFGVSASFRRKMAGKDPRSCSAYYNAGSWVGVGLTTAYGAAAGLEKAGMAGAGKEFSHWIPKRYGKAIGGPVGDFIQSNNRLNGNYVSIGEHALQDPSRYRSMPGVWKEANPLPGAATRQLSRIPNLPAGAGIGAAWGSVGRFLAGPCGN